MGGVRGGFIALLLLFATMLQAQSLLPYQNPQLSPAERARDLCSRLTLDEKEKLMMNSSPAIERLGIPKFDWWSEALHGIGRNGTCTVFPSCIGMAASFDDQLVRQIYDAVSDEARAKNTDLRKKGDVGRYQCLSFWTPTINIFRDPRWGRGQESYGEDPYLNSVMGQAVVSGLQGPSDSKYAKLFACAKHFAVHSGPEKSRHQMDISQLSPRDLWETYLPAFKDLVQKANVAEVMCAYQRFEGDPCCGSNRLLQQILRNEWGFRGLVVSDCGAVSDFWRKGRHGVSPNAAAASAKAVISGTDVECGSNYAKLSDAVKQGLITEQQIDVSVLRLLEGRFRLGDFDPDSLVEWTKIPLSVVASNEHKALARKMAQEQTVLLQNRGNILPLTKDADGLMLMGPNAADSIMLWGIYYGQPSHSVTVKEGLRNALGTDIPFQQACGITERTVQTSFFNRLRTPDGQNGMQATYWNNADWKGTPVRTDICTVPLKFDTGGNTVFAPNVNLNNFSASYVGTFTAEKNETVELPYIYTTGIRLIVNGDTILDRWHHDPIEYGSKKLKVEAGKDYTVQVDFRNETGNATLSFDITKSQDVDIPALVKSAERAKTIIFVGGISPTLEREEASVNAPGFERGDRTSIELPQVQRDILKALHEAGKKIVFVNCSGSAVALTPELETCDAIVQAWYAGEQGGNGIADVIFGTVNPSGKLPVTFYRDDSQLPAFDDYSMSNRTYRYFSGEPLFPFGYGLSYTTFEMSKPQYDRSSETVNVSVKNTGKVDGTQVVQVYVRNPRDTEGPKKTLRAFKRIDVKAGETVKASISLPRSAFELWDTATNTMCVKPGKYDVYVGASSDERDLQQISIRLK